MKRDFLTSPAAWMNAARTGTTRVDYACGVQVFRTQRTSWRDRALRLAAVLLALATIACVYA